MNLCYISYFNNESIFVMILFSHFSVPNSCAGVWTCKQHWLQGKSGTYNMLIISNYTVCHYSFLIYTCNFSLFAPQQLYQTLTDFDIRFYMYEILKVSAVTSGFLSALIDPASHHVFFIYYPCWVPLAGSRLLPQHGNHAQRRQTTQRHDRSWTQEG